MCRCLNSRGYIPYKHSWVREVDRRNGLTRNGNLRGSSSDLMVMLALYLSLAFYLFKPSHVQQTLKITSKNFVEFIEN